MKTLKSLDKAYDGSYYTIIGVDDPEEWRKGYERWLDEEGIGKPAEWFRTTGAAVNNYAQPDTDDTAFPPDLTILLFPLDGLHPGKLAMFKLRYEDRWFDDVVANM